MLQLWLYFVFSQQYHIVFQHKPALTLKSTPVTSAALLGHLTLTPHTLPELPPPLTAAPAEKKVHLFPLSYVATTYSPQLLLLGTKEENNLMCQFPSLGFWCGAGAATSARSAPPDLTFPTRRLSLLVEKSKLGQVLMSFLVGYRKEIKVQVKSILHGALFTFPILSYIPVPRLWEHSFAFPIRLKNLGPRAETIQGI